MERAHARVQVHVRALASAARNPAGLGHRPFLSLRFIE